MKFLIAWEADTETHTHTDFPAKSNFKPKINDSILPAKLKMCKLLIKKLNIFTVKLNTSGIVCKEGETY